MCFVRESNPWHVSQEANRFATISQYKIVGFSYRPIRYYLI